MEDDKKKIIQLFNSNIKNTKYVKKNNTCGNEGHYLEKLMGLTLNDHNKPDIFGYEMKKDCKKKITFGDYSASEYLFSKKTPILTKYNGKLLSITRELFMVYFGSIKNNRYSWSGSCVPKYGNVNEFGQILEFDKNNNLQIHYHYNLDKRTSKKDFPNFLKSKIPILIAIWTFEKLSNHINNKFDINGFFILKKTRNIYTSICFGTPFNFEYFVENIKNKNIIFDSGMYSGNSRNYSQFRSSMNNFWKKLIIEEY